MGGGREECCGGEHTSFWLCLFGKGSSHSPVTGSLCSARSYNNWYTWRRRRSKRRRRRRSKRRKRRGGRRGGVRGGGGGEGVRGGVRGEGGWECDVNKGTSVKYAFFFGSRLSWKSMSVSKMEPAWWEEGDTQLAAIVKSAKDTCPPLPNFSPPCLPPFLPLPPSPPLPPPPLPLPHRCWSPGGWVPCSVLFAPPCSTQQTLSELEPRGREGGEARRVGGRTAYQSEIPSNNDASQGSERIKESLP